MSTALTSATRRAVIRNIRQCAPATNSVQQICSLRLQTSKAQHETSRCYGSAAIEGSDNSSSNNNNNNNASMNNNNSVGNSYVSPFQEIFDTIQEGKTFLGTSEFQYPSVKLLKCGVAEHYLRFKTTTYGRLLEEPFVRANEHRIILQVAIRHVPLNDVERLVLKEIVGDRLNDETGVLQLSSSQFGSRIENKRHVVSMLERAVESARSLAARITEETSGSEAPTPSK